jgi:hypothetical protein
MLFQAFFAGFVTSWPLVRIIYVRTGKPNVVMHRRLVEICGGEAVDEALPVDWQLCSGEACLTYSHGKIGHVNVKTTAFWDIAPCSLVEVDGRIRGA